MKLILISFLLICAVSDIRYKRIPSIVVWSFVGVMAGYRVILLVRGDTSLGEVISSLLPGLLLYAFSFISKGVGNGDGLLIMATGCYFGGINHLGMLFFAFLLAAVVSMGMLIGKKGSKNKRIAFAPFLLTASGVMLLV